MHPQNTKKYWIPNELCCAFSFTNENIHINKNLNQINSNLMKYFLMNCAFLFFIVKIHLLIEYLWKLDVSNKDICINFDISIHNTYIQWYSIFNIFCISPQVFKFGISEYFIYVMWSRFSTYFSFISTPFSHSFCFLCIYITEKIQIVREGQKKVFTKCRLLYEMMIITQWNEAKRMLVKILMLKVSIVF